MYVSTVYGKTSEIWTPEIILGMVQEIEKDAERMANSVDLDHTAPIWVSTVSSDLSVPILRTFTIKDPRPA